MTVHVSLFASFKHYQGDRELTTVLNEIREGNYALSIRQLREYLWKRMDANKKSKIRSILEFLKTLIEVLLGKQKSES